MGPNSVLVTIGPEHMRQRKLLLPPFHGERMREYEDVIVEATPPDMAGWPLGRPMRLQPRTRGDHAGGDPDARSSASTPSAWSRCAGRSRR